MDSLRSMESLEHLKTTGCNFVAIVVTWYQQKPSSTHVYPINRPFQIVDPARGFWNYTFISETPNAVITAIRKARSLGMGVMLKPHLDLTEDGDGMWRGNIYGVPAWFVSYTKMMLMWARLAEREHVEMLSVSCELMQASMWEKEWRKLISAIRKVYFGKLTSASNWAAPGGGGELTQKKWRDALDYIATDEYMPLPEGPDVTVDMVVKAWIPLVEQFKKLSEKYNLPFILSEVGYCSGRKCLPNHHDSPRGEDAQAMHYEALLRVVLANSDWFHGLFFWNWVTDSAFGEYKHLGNKCMDPKWKKAELVLRTYYNATEPQPKRDENRKAKCICTL